MAKLAMPLFILGVIIAGSYAAFPVRAPKEGPKLTATQRLSQWGSKSGLPFGIGLVMVVAGGLLGRRRGKGGATTKDGPQSSPGELLTKIHAKLSALPRTDIEKDRRVVHETLDEILEELVPAFIEHRAAMIDSLGLGAFAEMIGQFAGMERNAARAWSCLTDEVYDEVPGCLEKADTALGHAVKTYEAAVKA